MAILILIRCDIKNESFNWHTVHIGQNAGIGHNAGYVKFWNYKRLRLKLMFKILLLVI